MALSCEWALVSLQNIFNYVLLLVEFLLNSRKKRVVVVWIINRQSAHRFYSGDLRDVYDYRLVQ